MNVRPASLDLQLHYPFCYLDTKNNSDKIDHVINYMSHQFAKCFDVQYFFFLHFKTYLCAAVGGN